MFSRFTLYFDEVARSGSLRRASERLNVSPSAIDRHILLMEQNMGVPLFVRIPQGLRLTAAGEVLITNIRRWRRELDHAQAHINDLKGLRRGEVTLALVDGASNFAAVILANFRSQYPGIVFNLISTDAADVVERILDASAELGLLFNPPQTPSIRIESKIVCQVGAVVPPDHPLAEKDEPCFADCVEHGLIIPNTNLSVRAIIDEYWARTFGGPTQTSFTANSIEMIKDLILEGCGIGMLTPIDITKEAAAGTLVYRPLAENSMLLPIFSLITASGGSSSAAASLLKQHIAQSMREPRGTDILCV